MKSSLQNVSPRLSGLIFVELPMYTVYMKVVLNLKGNRILPSYKVLSIKAARDLKSNCTCTCTKAG